MAELAAILIEAIVEQRDQLNAEGAPFVGRLSFHVDLDANVAMRSVQVRVRSSGPTPLERLEAQATVVEEARKDFASARSALGEGQCTSVSDTQRCEGCETERQDARDYLDEGLARIGSLPLS